MHIYHFVLVTFSFSCGASAAAGNTLDLREVAANDLSTSDAVSQSSSGAAPNHQQATDKPQCALDVASLNRGDVQIELP
eukprot:scaffold21699_cov82-Skeletonema_dohrnii-CCMP3373.AAC.1